MVLFCVKFSLTPFLEPREYRTWLWATTAYCHITFWIWKSNCDVYMRSVSILDGFVLIDPQPTATNHTKLKKLIWRPETRCHPSAHLFDFRISRFSVGYFFCPALLQINSRELENLVPMLNEANPAGYGANYPQGDHHAQGRLWCEPLDYHLAQRR